MIHNEVKNAVNDLSINHSIIKDETNINVKDISNDLTLKDIIEVQKEEINYLRKQLTIVNSQKEEFIKNYFVNGCNNNDQTQLVETLKITRIILKSNY